MTKDYFIRYTAGLSLISAILYIWKGITESFFIGTYIYIIMNLIYIPLSLILKRKVFCPFQICYSFILIFIYAFCPSYLYNNYSAFLVVCIVILYKPHWKKAALLSYAILISVAFALNTETICHYLIHVVRCTYFFFVFYFVIHNRFERISNKRKIIALQLTEDEVAILDQLVEGKKQKEIDGYSINTVTKKLNNAKTRNNLGTTQELLFKYIEEINTKM